MNEEQFPIVRNMISERSGREVPNQFIISIGRRDYFQSYKTLIAYEEGCEIVLDQQALEYSRTTNKYLYSFLGLSRQQIKEQIKLDVIKVKDLNHR